MATVSEKFSRDLQKERDAFIASGVNSRIKGQFSDNIDADGSALAQLISPHINSFNWMMEKDGGLDLAVKNLPTFTIRPTEQLPIPETTFYISKVSFGKPTFSSAETGGDVRMLPHQARELGLTYDAPLNLTLERKVGEGAWETIVCQCGRVPVMVKSKACHLAGLSRKQMVEHKEEAGEWGGYFILNGNERLVRLLIMNRRNHIFSIVRSSFLKRGPDYTKYATSIRCVRNDMSAQTINCHYLENGTINVRFAVRKQEFFIPAILVIKALTGATDREIYEKITMNDPTLAFEAERTELMIRDAKKLRLHTRSDVLAYIGRHFRGMLRADPYVSDAQVGADLFREYLFIHVQDSADRLSEEAINNAKVDILITMIQNLYQLVQEKIKPDNIDAMSSHECLLPGHLYNMLLKESLFDWLSAIKGSIIRDARFKNEKQKLTDINYWRKLLNSIPEIGSKLRYFLVTGNVRSRSGLDLMQISGYTVVAEKLNYYRYLSHFRSIHRGQFFTTMKTTAVRKLLPESWGFLCPVHTPDGSPCGLLNHMAAACDILTHPCTIPMKDTINTLFTLGMIDPAHVQKKEHAPVFLDGILVGRIPLSEIPQFAARIRYLKVTNHPAMYKYLEISVVADDSDRMWPGIFLATNAARFVRPVYYLPTKAVPEPVVEHIGAMEQLTMEIGCTSADFHPGLTTHQEISPTNMLSVIASLTPFSDHNQSPRNMYQCQMGKQTMGTPFHSFPYRVDNKVFRIQNVQAPIVRNEGPYRKYLFDEYPMGVNAIVAVISYTGYDMEDAMIINKSAYERGFGHGSVYKYKVIDLGEKKVSGEPIHHRFSNHSSSTRMATEKLDVDGLPRVGQLVHPDEPLAAVYNDVSKTTKLEKFKDTEPAWIEEVRALGSETPEELQKVGLWLRMDRNPVTGDKFSSRHGQKGVLSILFPQIDMPWTESGLSPDVIINPHAFPSRMTIGMLVESMAGKAGAIHGRFQDGTPFQFSEKNRAVDFFGEQLRAAGYNYLGSEPLYSGISGEPMVADIFIGCVFYQRLRHMVKDKFQARATGPINSITRQPIKGRKVHGGIRFGEMERDSLVAHGISYFLNDRLMKSSDYHTTYCCSDCGSLLAAHSVPATQSTDSSEHPVTCRICGTGDKVSVIAIPFVFLYLVNELAAMNIRLTIDVK